MPLATSREDRSQHERDLVSHLVHGSELVWRLAYVVQEANKDNSDAAWSAILQDIGSTMYDLGQALFAFALELEADENPDIPF